MCSPGSVIVQGGIVDALGSVPLEVEGDYHNCSVLYLVW